MPFLSDQLIVYMKQLIGVYKLVSQGYYTVKNVEKRTLFGQSLVEFAVSLPMLLLVLLGIFEAARWFQAYLAVQYSAREAARFAVTGNPPMKISDGEGSCEELGHPGTGLAYSLPGDYQECRVD
jgi:hypothetical protein